MSELYIKLGKLLKAERERQNKPLPELALDLKIAEAHLLAIEAGDLAGVPSELYFKLFAKSYAEALGLDYVKVMDVIRDDVGEAEYMAAEGNTAPPPSPFRPTPRSRPSEIRRNNTGTWVLVIIGIIILGGVAWVVLSARGKSLLSGRDADTTIVADTVSKDVDTGYVAGTNASRENSALNLDLIARDRTWAVVIADGDTALQTNLKPWREYYIGAQDSLVVSIGSPLSIETMLNGSAANLTSPEDGSISQVVITPANSGMYLQRATDTAQSFRDSGFIDSVKGDTLGTGRSSSKQGVADTSSTSRGTTDGT